MIVGWSIRAQAPFWSRSTWLPRTTPNIATRCTGIWRYDKLAVKTGPTSIRAEAEQADGPWLEIAVSADTELDACTNVSGQERPYQGWFFPAFLQVEEAPTIVCQYEGGNVTLTTAMEPHP
jgi:hypothetical protein